MTENMFSNIPRVSTRHVGHEKKSGVNLISQWLVGPSLERKQKQPRIQVVPSLIWFPVMIPQATARWDSPQISSHFYRGLLTWLEHGAIMIRSGDRGLKSKRLNDFLFTGHLTIIATTSTRLSSSTIFEFQTSDVSRAVALDVGFRK